jgi:hypothetical protein
MAIGFFFLNATPLKNLQNVKSSPSLTAERASYCFKPSITQWVERDQEGLKGTKTNFEDGFKAAATTVRGDGTVHRIRQKIHLVPLS